jgi:anti-sigma B factor antagonist
VAGADGDPLVAGAEPVSVVADITPDLTTVVISGELDAAGVPALSARLSQVLARPPRRLVFDLAQVAFIDCAATRLIISSAEFLPSDGRPVLLRRPSPAVRRILDLTEMGAACELEPDPASRPDAPIP